MTFAFPRTFFKEFFVRPINLSQKPPYHGARFGINFHWIPRLLRLVFNSAELNSRVNSSAADWYVDALSDTIIFGKDLRIFEMQT